MTLITESEQLKNAINNLQGEEFIAIDTEFDRRTTYYPKLCLVQIAGKDAAFAIDVLAEKLDLAPLKQLLADKSVLKVFHSCREDMETIYHIYRIMPEPVFDTQIAANILGYGESVSYASMVEAITKEHIDKSYRYSDWTFRPLSKQQIDYALSDVTHLRKLYIELRAMIKKSDKIGHADLEMSKLLDLSKYVNNPEEAWKRFSSERLNERVFEKIRAIAEWREATAQKRDMPRQWVIKDGLVKKVAELSVEGNREDDVKRILTEAKIGKSFIDEIINDFVKRKENA